MKRILLIVFVSSLFQSSFLFAQRMEWLKYSTGSAVYGDRVFADVDSMGNTYVFCNFQPGMIVEGQTYNGFGGSDLLLIKYDPAGNHVWTAIMQAGNYVFGRNIAVDKAGNSYVVGFFQSSININDTINFTNSQGDFVIKFNTNGAYVSMFQYQSEVFVAEDDYNIYIAGNNFLEKRDSALNLIWQRTIAPSNAMTFTGPAFYDGKMAVKNGRILLSGYTGWSNQTSQFGGMNMSFPAGNNENVTLALDTAGNGLWYDYYIPNYQNGTRPITGMNLDNNGNAYVMVDGSNTLYWNNDTIVNSADTTRGWSALLKYDSNGSKMWSRILYYSGQGNGSDVAVNNAGEVLAAGAYNTGSVYVENHISNPAIIGYWMYKVDSTNTFNWAYSSAGGGSYNAKCMSAVTKNDSTYIICGIKAANAAFDCYVVPDNSPGFFVGELSNNQPVQPTASFQYSDSSNVFSMMNMSTNYDSLYWDFGDSTYSIEENPVHTYVNGNNYTITLYAYNGICVDVDSIQIIGVGVSPVNANEFSIFPNPATSLIQLKASNANSMQITISDVEGRIVVEKEVATENGLATVDVSTLHSGSYIVNAIIDSKVYRRTLIVR